LSESKPIEIAIGSTFPSPRAQSDAVEALQEFHATKARDLQIRPVRHRIEPRVRAHVFLCMLG